MWYRAFGWLENPFSIKPTPNIIGLEETKESLLQDLRSGSPALPPRPNRRGKKLSSSFGHEIDCLTRPSPPVYLNLYELPALQEGMLQARLRLAFLLRRFRLSPGAILLADEANALQPQAGEWVKAMFDQGPLFSFALAAPEEPPLPPRIPPIMSYPCPRGSPSSSTAWTGKNPFTEETLILLAEAAPSPRALQAAELGWP